MSINKLKKTLLKAHRGSQTQISSLSEQVAGDWYKKLKIQPIDYCMHNNLNACQTKLIKYATRCLIKNKDKKARKDEFTERGFLFASKDDETYNIAKGVFEELC